MFCVAICDDEEVVCQGIESYLEPYINDKGICVRTFQSGEALYEAISQGESFDLIFLDIELEVLDGIAVGQKIREELCNETVHIVFISGKQKYAMELFALRPLHFLTKPFTKRQVTEVVKKAMDLSVIYKDFFEFQIEQRLHRVRYGEILYFESRVRKIILHTEREAYEFYGKLKDIEEKNHDRFLRIHQSFMVNLLYVEHYEYNRVILFNGDSLPISESYRTPVKEQLLKNWRKR